MENPSSPSLTVSEVAPRILQNTGRGRWFLDFGRAVFGTLRIQLHGQQEGQEIRVRLGEKRAGESSVDRDPGGSVRYRETTLRLSAGTERYQVEIPPDARNTGPRAIRMPTSIGEVMPFRYAELEGVPGELTAEDVRQTFVHAPFDDQAASFESSDPVLNEVWDLCRHTIKATTFCGHYVDGDRERIPYEGDAYINMLSHFCLDTDTRMSRATLQYLMRCATWPADWQLHTPLIAWYDYLYSGDDTFLRDQYATLKRKTLHELAGADGLLRLSNAKVPQDLLEALGFDDFFQDQNLKEMVDWPPAGFGGESVPGERDDYEFSEVNAAPNALYYRALILMHRVAATLGEREDASYFQGLIEKVKRSFRDAFYDMRRGLFVDGTGTDHASQHANFFPLMAGLVRGEELPGVVAHVKRRGMACSVYGAQHLLDGLYRAGEARHALSLLTSTDERSWHAMIHRIGSTMTLEAWAPRFKPNLDWNHAWGTAPTNVIVRRLLGVRPAAPGFSKAIIEPQPGDLEWARARVPTLGGPILISWERDETGRRLLSLELPDGMEGTVCLRSDSGFQPTTRRVQGGAHRFASGSGGL